METRQIGLWGTSARIVAGATLLVWATFGPPTAADLLIGLLAMPVAVLALLALRGRDAQPLRAEGGSGHLLNCAIAFALFTWQPVAAALFYGGSMVLAAMRGMGACEMFAISNLLRGRDDRLGCPLFLPVDATEAAVAARHGSLDRNETT